MSENIAAPAPVEAPSKPAAPAVPFLAAPAVPTPVTPAPQHFFGDHVVKDGTFQEGWSSELAKSHPALANQMARYKTEADAFAGLENLVKTVGRKQAGVSYPKEGSTPEEIAAYRADAGVPGRAEEYMLKPEKMPDGATWDELTGKEFSDLAHAQHLPKGAAKAIIDFHIGKVSAQAAADAAAYESRLGSMVQQTQAVFQKEWGVNHDTRLAANGDFLTTIFTKEELATPEMKIALSTPAMVRIIDTARRETREAPLPGTVNSTAIGSQSPREQAKSIMASNPKWRSDRVLTDRVNSLYAQESAAMQRKAR